MKLPLALCVLGALTLASCLPDPEPVNGVSIHPGVAIEDAQFVSFDKQPWVVFGVRQAEPENGYGARLDLYRAHWLDPAPLPEGVDPNSVPPRPPSFEAPQLMVSDYVDRPEWSPPAVDAEGVRYYMKDERMALDAGAAAAGTLNRMRVTGEVVETIPDVINYGLSPSNRLLQYRKYIPGSRFQELHLRDLHGTERVLGLASGPAQWSGLMLDQAGNPVDAPFYYVVGEDHTLSSVPGLTGDPQVLRSHVSRNMMREDHLFAVLAVSEIEKVRTFVFDATTRAEIDLPVENPCCWIALHGNVFEFSDSAKGDKPAALHFFDFTTKQDRVVDMPAGMTKVGVMMPRPPDYTETLIFDSQNQMAVWKPDADPPVHLTNLHPFQSSFTDDGRYLLYIDPDPPPPTPTATPLDLGGRLMVQDADDYTLPSRQLSPHGASVPLNQRGYYTTKSEQFPVVFWAHYGFGASDLYFGNHVTGQYTKVADGISEVTVTQRRVVGVVRVSLQDLTGDLVQKDLMTGVEQLIEHNVAQTAIYGNRIAFLVRDRSAGSPRNGLWGATLPELGQPTGMVMATPPNPMGGGGN